MKLNIIFKFVTVTIFFLLSLACTQKSSLSVSDLKCEFLIDPLGINTKYPRFNWENLSEVRGAHQTAFQIVVATDINKLSENKADCWNSGKIHSSESILVKYEGLELSPGQLLYWKVKVWDENDKDSQWSNPAKFSIGLIDKDNWSALYIGYTENENEDEVNKIVDGFQACPQFRKQFTVDNKSIKETYLLHVNSLGYHEVYLNGVKVGENVLSPAVSQLDKRSLINTYDVTDYINSGINNLIFWIGSGWYTEGLPGVTEKGPVVKAQLEKVSGAKVEKV
ncbi:MAG: alpha-L-rhamnosidase N-terminal domain-containing protein, partial [Proteiniphilum sp.]